LYISAGLNNELATDESVHFFETRIFAAGGHSLRVGFLTSVVRRGAPVFKMRDVSRHKSMCCRLI